MIASEQDTRADLLSLDGADTPLCYAEHMRRAWLVYQEAARVRQPLADPFKQHLLLVAEMARHTHTERGRWLLMGQTALAVQMTDMVAAACRAQLERGTAQ